MIKKTKPEEFIKALLNHLDETKNRVPDMEQVFDALDKRTKSGKCEQNDDLNKDAENRIAKRSNCK